MPKFVALALYAIAIAGGGAGGYFAKSMLADAAGGADGTMEHSDHGATNHKKSADHEKAAPHGNLKKPEAGDHGGLPTEGLAYFKFSRQFVVPVIDEAGVDALVILDLNLAMDSAASEGFYVNEPKLRDILMEELLALANEGRFSGVLTDRRNLELMRMELLTAVQQFSGPDVTEVLILDIMRQDL